MPKMSPVTTSGDIPRNLKNRAVAGAAAGNLTVTGIKKDDRLLFVGGFNLATTLAAALKTAVNALIVDATANRSKINAIITAAATDLATIAALPALGAMTAANVAAAADSLSVINDLTSEFTITADNTINNTGGTSSAGGILIVVWGTRDAAFGA